MFDCTVCIVMKKYEGDDAESIYNGKGAVEANDKVMEKVNDL